jgi:hypothetical protein
MHNEENILPLVLQCAVVSGQARRRPTIVLQGWPQNQQRGSSIQPKGLDAFASPMCQWEYKVWRAATLWVYFMTDSNQTCGFKQTWMNDVDVSMMSGWEPSTCHGHCLDHHFLLQLAKKTQRHVICHVPWCCWCGMALWTVIDTCTV